MRSSPQKKSFYMFNNKSAALINIFHVHISLCVRVLFRLITFDKVLPIAIYLRFLLDRNMCVLAIRFLQKGIFFAS